MSGHKSDLLSASTPPSASQKKKPDKIIMIKMFFSFAFATFTAKFSFDFAVNVRGVLGLLCTGLLLFPK